MKKEIKIFFASSEELEDDRNAFGNFIRRLGKIYDKRGIKLDLFEWEDFDSAYNNVRKQDEYNDNVRASDIFVAAFHKKAGKFTIEEFDVAIDEFKQNQHPKVYVYCRELKDGEIETDELQAFKRRLFDEMGHYWIKYSNRDTMQLQFVLQLQMVEASSEDAIKVENGEVKFEGATIAHMSNLPFAALNEDFQKMNSRIQELPKKIEKARLRLEKYPDEEDFQDDLQKLLNEYNDLKEKFADYQKNLFATAKRVAQLQGRRITDRIHRAIEAFNLGKIREANIILDEAEKDGERALEDFLNSKEITEQKRINVFNSIEELMLKASTIMADESIEIESRIEKTSSLYAQADDMAEKADYDKEKHIDLLTKYIEHLYKYADYKQAQEIATKAISMSETQFGEIHPITACLYICIGEIHRATCEYSKALLFHKKALNIRTQHYGETHSDVATSHNKVGLTYIDLGEYNTALIYFKKAISIRIQIHGVSHSSVATSYNSIGIAYANIGKCDKALFYFEKSLSIELSIFGERHPRLASSYNNIGIAYDMIGEYETALIHYKKSLAICMLFWGEKHPMVGDSYNNIGITYYNLCNYKKALSSYKKSLAITLRIFGETHTNIAESYNNIGKVYDLQCEYHKALEAFEKALEIRYQIFGANHALVNDLANSVYSVYQKLLPQDSSILPRYEEFMKNIASIATINEDK